MTMYSLHQTNSTLFCHLWNKRRRHISLRNIRLSSRIRDMKQAVSMATHHHLYSSVI